MTDRLQLGTVYGVQVDPRYESRIAEIKERWYKLSKNTGSLREQDKRAALGTEVWGSSMLAKVSTPPPHPQPLHTPHPLPLPPSNPAVPPSRCRCRAATCSCILECCLVLRLLYSFLVSAGSTDGFLNLQAAAHATNIRPLPPSPCR